MSKQSPRLAEPNKCPVTERIVRWTAILAPLIVVPWLIDAYNLPKMTLLCCGVSIAWITGWRDCFRKDNLSFQFSLLDKVLLCWLALYGIATIFSVNIWQSVWGQYRFHGFGFVTAVAGCALYFLLKRVGIAASALKGLLISGAVIAFAVLAEYAAGNRGRINSLSGSPIYFAGFLVPLTPIALSHYFSTKKVRWFILFVVFLLAMVVSMARSAWIAEIVALVILCSITFIRNTNRKAVFMAGAGIIAIIASALLFTPARAKFSTIGQSEYYSNVSRTEGWKSAVKAIQLHPITGYGPDNFIIAFRNNKTEKYFKVTGKGMAQAHAHNDMLQMATTAGIPCAVVYAVAWLLILIGGAKQLVKDNYGTGLFAAAVGLLIYLQFNNGMMGTVMMFWVLAACIAGNQKLSLRNDNKGRSNHLVVPVVAVCFLIVSLFPLWGEAMFVRGVRYSIDGDMMAAIGSFESSCRLAPSVDDYYRAAQDTAVSFARTLPDHLARNELMQRAVRTAETNTRRNAANPDAWHNLAAVLVAQYQLTGVDTRGMAAKAIVQSIRLDPYNVDALAGFAGISVLLGRPEQAQRLWTAVQAMDPVNKEAEKYFKGRKQEK